MSVTNVKAAAKASKAAKIPKKSAQNAAVEQAVQRPAGHSVRGNRCGR